MKTKTQNIFLVLSAILIGLFSISMDKPKSNLLVGTWKAIKALDETGVECDIGFPIKSSCVMTFYKDSTYEAIVQKNENSRRDNGRYTIVKRASNVFLHFSETKVELPYMSHSQDVDDLNYPIIKLTKDSLFLRYNLCCEKDTCDNNSGIVIFLKEKKVE